ncbi:hypothetical protein BGZ98_004783 [Dissophora globulifera]|nr:hypothetical protein BGZ98_004783 [Dissophora globulifera]
MKKAAPAPRAKATASKPAAAREKAPTKKQQCSDDEDSDAEDDARDAEMQGESGDDGEEDVLTRHTTRALLSGPLYMMSLVCVATRLIHGFSRKASYWISELKAKFPDYKIQQAKLYSARLMDSKDKAMQEIVEQRQ